MNKDETNGYLKAVEAQLRAVEVLLEEINRSGDLNDQAWESFRVAKVDLTNFVSGFSVIRGWNCERNP
jgi:hypothetical protein